MSTKKNTIFSFVPKEEKKEETKIQEKEPDKEKHETEENKEEKKKESLNTTKLKQFREKITQLNLLENQRRIIDFLYRETFYNVFPLSIFTLSIWCKLEPSIVESTINELLKLGYVQLDTSNTFLDVHYYLSKELKNMGNGKTNV